MCEIINIGRCQSKTKHPCPYGFEPIRLFSCDNNTVRYNCSRKVHMSANSSANELKKVICDGSLKKYCPSLTGVSEFDHKRCSKWCLKHPGECDDAVKNFCKENPSDSLCSCVNSELNKKPFAENTTMCFDNMCKKPSAYKTAANVATMKNGCPNMVQCEKKINKQDIDGSRVDINKFKNCLIKNKSSKKHPVLEFHPLLQKKAKPNNSILLFAFFFILIIFLAIISVFVLRGRGNYRKNINL